MLTSINQSKTYKIFLFAITLLLGGCKKFVQINPPVTKITGETVYSNNTSAAAAMTGIYNNMIASPSFSSGNNSIGYLTGLAADELKNYSSTITFIQFYQNALSSSSNGNSNAYFWPGLYNKIYDANAVIEGLNNSNGVSDSIKRQLIGEAEFMRAFLHFYAVNLYGDVPLVTTTDYQINNSIHRTPVERIYQQIVADLRDAQNKLTDDFVDYSGLTTSERTRPNKAAATALLARAYLYTGKWDSAETQATAIINNNSRYTIVNNFDSIFLANSSEAIWQLQPVTPGHNTYDGQYFVLTSTPGSASLSVALSTNLMNAFETGDKRLSNWVGTYKKSGANQSYYFPYKYKIYKVSTSQPVTEYTMVLRLAEQYLIRAEARAQQGNIQGSQDDLNTIRARAGLPNTLANDQSTLLTAISHERQVELFTEWGHRWLDLKRTGAVNSVMSVVTPQKGGSSWSSNWALLPIPLSELTINPNLVQNPGYN